jgi:agmatine deiminase
MTGNMQSLINGRTPKELGYSFPAEWGKHRATWLSYPHDDSYSWPGRLHEIFPFYNRFIATVAKGERVGLNVRSRELKDKVMRDLDAIGADLGNIDFFIHPTNDSWCRDYGPAFVVRNSPDDPKVIVSWKYNAWGEKYPHDLDEQIPGLIGKHYGIPVVYPGIVMEGGAVEFNGSGTLLTTTACLLNENRNSNLNQARIEEYLVNYYGVEQVLWLGEGIAGDDTNGHVDDITRFFQEDGVITVVEPRKHDHNHTILAENLKLLKKMRLHDGRQLDIAEIPMPSPVIYDDQRLPASYANFYISNHAVIVPLYRCKEDDVAMGTLEKCFPDRKVVGIESVEIIWGLGSFHCLSQQEPAVST